VVRQAAHNPQAGPGQVEVSKSGNAEPGRNDFDRDRDVELGGNFLNLVRQYIEHESVGDAEPSGEARHPSYLLLKVAPYAHFGDYGTDDPLVEPLIYERSDEKRFNCSVSRH
jgi:hypothetical protein